MRRTRRIPRSNAKILSSILSGSTIYFVNFLLFPDRLSVRRIAAIGFVCRLDL